MYLCHDFVPIYKPSSFDVNSTQMLVKSSMKSICRICGDRARGNNFQVKSCMSCKSFFRRNALLPWVIYSSLHLE